MKINKMLAEYEKHRNKRYTFGVLDMNTIQEKSKDNFERMTNSFRYGYIQGRKKQEAFKNLEGKRLESLDLR